MAGMVFGSLLLRVFSQDDYPVSWITVILGIVLLYGRVYILRSLVPFLGPLVYLVFFLVAFGSVFQRVWLKARAAT